MPDRSASLPPGGCGGIWGYQELLEILTDPGHPGHGNRLEWLGFSSVHEFNPTTVDLANIKPNPSKLAIVLAKK